MRTAGEGLMANVLHGWQVRRSLARRVTLLTMLAVGLVVAVFAVGSYFVVRAQLQSATDSSLLQRAQEAARGYAAPTEQIPLWVLGAGDFGLATVDGRTGHVWVSPGEAATFPHLGNQELAVAQGRSAYSLRTISAHGKNYRVATMPAQQGVALVVAQPLSSQDRVLTRLGILMLAFGLAGVIVAGISGWGVASGGLRPVRRLTEEVERISCTEDLTPIPVEGDDEIARLSQSFNGLLVALSASRDRQRQLIADAGHELRTPLTSMRTNIELLTQAGPALGTFQRTELLDDISAQMEEMTTLIGDLVELARDEPLRPVLAPVDLPEVVDDAVVRVRRRAPWLDWSVESEAWWVIGDASGLERAITNLLDNAAKWSPATGTVRVSLRGGVLTVDDEGPGIPEADLPHVFDRFYRATDSRSMPGSGLGLSIVRQIAERHSGSVTAAASPHGGARLVLRLPGSSMPAPDGAPEVVDR